MAQACMASQKRKSDFNTKGSSHAPSKKLKIVTKKQNQSKHMLKETKPDPSENDTWSSDSDDDSGGVSLKTEQNSPKIAAGHGSSGKFSSGTDTKANNNKNLSSRERHEEQKRLAQERKLAKPLGEQLQRLKKIWERLRIKTQVPKDERDALVNELFGICEGKFKELITKHDAVRVVQTALKYSNPIQRKAVAKELQGAYVSFACNKYSKFLIDKLLGYEDTEIRNLIIPEFYGHIRKLMPHPEAGWVIDDIYRKAATTEQKALMLREWYGREFAVFKDVGAGSPTSDLCEILEKEPGKRTTIMRSLMDLINQLVQKGYTSFTSLHAAMLQYLLAVRPGTEEYQEFMDLCIDEEREVMTTLPFTEPGSRLASLLLAHGTARERKLMLRAFKDKAQSMSVDINAHVVILAAYETVDDTRAMFRSLLAQIITPSSDESQAELIHLVANDLYARTTLLYLISGPSRTIFPAQLARDLDILDEVIARRVTTSKKDPELRRADLLGMMSQPLLDTIAAIPNDMVTTSFGAQFVTEVLLGAVGDKSVAVKAVAALASGDTADPVHLANYPFTGRMFKSLVAGGRYDKKQGKTIPLDPPLDFATAFYEQIKGQEIGWATGPSSFAVLSLLESDELSEKCKTKLKATLLKHVGELEKACEPVPTDESCKKGGVSVEGSKVTEDTRNNKKDKAKKVNERGGVRNMGTKLILEKIKL